MNDPRQQRGTHTWDIVIDYVRCPSCGYIQENREKYEKRDGRYEKDFRCQRCEYTFTNQKKYRPDEATLILE